MSCPKSKYTKTTTKRLIHKNTFGTLLRINTMLKSIFNIIHNKSPFKTNKGLGTSETNIQNDPNLPFAVVRDDGKLIHQFKDFNEASLFALKLNISYSENGVKASCKVIKLSN